MASRSPIDDSETAPLGTHASAAAPVWSPPPLRRQSPRQILALGLTERLVSYGRKDVWYKGFFKKKLLLVFSRCCLRDPKMLKLCTLILHARDRFISNLTLDCFE